MQRRNPLFYKLSGSSGIRILEKEKKESMIMLIRMSKKLIFFIVAVVFAWFAISFADTMLHNLSDMEYAAWNVFEVIDKFR